jgi:tetratricopeptide (TPR) repeat protein
MARRYDEAISQFRKTPLDMGAINQQVYLATGIAYAKKSQYDEALTAMQQGLARTGGNAPQAKAHLAYAYAEAGRRQDAESLLDELARESRDERTPRPVIAAAYACLGQMDRAFEQLETAYAERDARLVYVKVDPIFDCARKDSRFAGFVKRFGVGP